MTKFSSQDNKEHWTNLANRFGKNLQATTKTSTAKEIEIHALLNCVSELQLNTDSNLKILEAGCGNGINLFKLHEKFPNFMLEGFDYVSRMIESAKSIQTELRIPSSALKFSEASFEDYKIEIEHFDLIFTVRALINLPSFEKQRIAIMKLSSGIRKGGYLVMLENSQQSFELQNSLRVKLGLLPRIQAEYNHFIDEDKLKKMIESTNLEIVKVQDFISLHDLILYVLLPKLNEDFIDYENELVSLTTKLLKKLSLYEMNLLGPFGQNRLFIYRKI